jgi:hypothetical protein
VLESVRSCKIDCVQAYAKAYALALIETGTVATMKPEMYAGTDAFICPLMQAGTAETYRDL